MPNRLMLVRFVLAGLSLALPAITVTAQAIDASRMSARVHVLASDSLEGRGAGTVGGVRARTFLREAFADAGLAPFEGSFDQPFTFTNASANTEVEGVNLVGYVRGTTYPDRFIVVTAHYDHLGVRDGVIYNGADDNASGTAALLELAAYVAAHPLQHSVLFAALDAEEQGLQGARALLATLPVAPEALRLNLNMDMVGRSEAGELYAAGTYHYPFLKPALDAVAERSAITLRFGHDRPDLPAGDDWTGASDHGVFHRAGIPFVYFGVEDHPDYHKPTDDADRIDPAFHAHAAATVLDALITLDGQLDAVVGE